MFQPHIERRFATSKKSKLHKGSFLQFLERISSAFFHIHAEECASLSERFSYRLFQDHSTLGIWTHVSSSPMKLKLGANNYEIDEETVFFFFVHRGICKIQSGDIACDLEKDNFVVLSGKQDLIIETIGTSEWSFLFFPKTYFFTHSGFRSDHAFGIVFKPTTEIRRFFCSAYRRAVLSAPLVLPGELENMVDAMCVLMRPELDTFFQNFTAQLPKKSDLY